MNTILNILNMIASLWALLAHETTYSLKLLVLTQHTFMCLIILKNLGKTNFTSFFDAK